MDKQRGRSAAVLSHPYTVVAGPTTRRSRRQETLISGLDFADIKVSLVTSTPSGSWRVTIYESKNRRPAEKGRPRSAGQNRPARSRADGLPWNPGGARGKVPGNRTPWRPGPMGGTNRRSLP